ncbi:Rho GTPase activating protein 24 [Balamuthia mandrillaris]
MEEDERKSAVGTSDNTTATSNSSNRKPHSSERRRCQLEMIGGRGRGSGVHNPNQRNSRVVVVTSSSSASAFSSSASSALPVDRRSATTTATNDTLFQSQRDISPFPSRKTLPSPVTSFRRVSPAAQQKKEEKEEEGEEEEEDDRMRFFEFSSSDSASCSPRPTLTKDPSALSVGYFSFDNSVTKKGWLQQKGGLVNSLKKRWFVLQHNRLYYYRHPQDDTPLGFIPLARCCFRLSSVQRKNTAKRRRYCLELYDPLRVFSKRHPSFNIFADSQEELEEWIQALNLEDLAGLWGSSSALLSPSPIVKEGWLTKRGGRVKSWRRRWFVLRDSMLHYYRDEKKLEALGFIPVDQCFIRVLSTAEDFQKNRIRNKPTTHSPSLCLILSLFTPFCWRIGLPEKKRQFIFEITDICRSFSRRHKSFFLKADSEPIMDAWISQLCCARFKTNFSQNDSLSSSPSSSSPHNPPSKDRINRNRFSRRRRAGSIGLKLAEDEFIIQINSGDPDAVASRYGMENLGLVPEISPFSYRFRRTLQPSSSQSVNYFFSALAADSSIFCSFSSASSSPLRSNSSSSSSSFSHAIHNNRVHRKDEKEEEEENEHEEEIDFVRRVEWNDDEGEEESDTEPEMREENINGVLDIDTMPGGQKDGNKAKEEEEEWEWKWDWQRSEEEAEDKKEEEEQQNLVQCILWIIESLDDFGVHHSAIFDVITNTDPLFQPWRSLVEGIQERKWHLKRLKWFFADKESFFHLSSHRHNRTTISNNAFSPPCSPPPFSPPSFSPLSSRSAADKSFAYVMAERRARLLTNLLFHALRHLNIPLLLSSSSSSQLQHTMSTRSLQEIIHHSLSPLHQNLLQSLLTFINHIAISRHLPLQQVIVAFVPFFSSPSFSLASSSNGWKTQRKRSTNKRPKSYSQNGCFISTQRNSIGTSSLGSNNDNNHLSPVVLLSTASQWQSARRSSSSASSASSSFSSSTSLSPSPSFSPSPSPSSWSKAEMKYRYQRRENEEAEEETERSLLGESDHEWMKELKDSAVANTAKLIERLIEEYDLLFLVEASFLKE